MDEFRPRFAHLETNRLEEGIDVRLGGGSDRPAERNIFALAILRQSGWMIRGVEREKEDTKLPRIGGRIGERFLELSDILDARAATTRVDRQQNDGITGELRQFARAPVLIDPVDRSNAASALRRQIDHCAEHICREREDE